jgi:hypothetical protein
MYAVPPKPTVKFKPGRCMRQVLEAADEGSETPPAKTDADITANA